MDRRPAFEVIRRDDGPPENWHRYQIFSDGEIKGFGDATIVINRIPIEINQRTACALSKVPA